MNQKEHQELNQLKILLNFRINKQEKLLEKIINGKWKSTQVSDQVLYSLAKHDLKLLEAKKQDVETHLSNLDERNNDNRS